MGFSFKKLGKFVRKTAAKVDPTTKDGWRNIGGAMAGVATLGVTQIPQVRQAARWVDPSTKDGLGHLAVVGVVVASTAATIVTAGAAAPAGAAAIVAMAGAGAVGLAKGAGKIAAIDAAEKAKRIAAAAAAAKLAAGGNAGAAVTAPAGVGVVTGGPRFLDRLRAWLFTGWR